MTRLLRLEGESTLSVWARRFVSFSLYGVLGGLALGLLPVLVPLAMVVDTLLGQGRRQPRARALCFFGLYLACEIWGLFAAFGVWLLHRNTAAFLPRNADLQRAWSSALFFGAKRIFGFAVTFEEEAWDPQQPFLLFVRHSSTADTVLAAALMANPKKLLLKYVLKRELLWDPCLDVVGRRLPNAFVDRSGSRKDAEVRAVASLGRDLAPWQGVLIYPEGSRFDARKRDARVEGLKDQPALYEIAKGMNHVLPPKLGGALALIEAAPEAQIIVLEHTGFEGAATFGRFLRGDLVSAKLRVRLRKVERPEGAARDAWLFGVWAATDRWIAAAQTQG
jgi:1-acyl-sn-glycerol-3-phosphate acyltransferase